MLIVSFSTNKLEGMAIAKLSFMLALGAAGPYFFKGDIQYLLSPLPSFWAAKAVQANQPVYFIIVFIVSGLWFLLLGRRFLRKTEK
jgi:fluoroquinolone transport system permease protein